MSHCYNFTRTIFENMRPLLVMYVLCLQQFRTNARPNFFLFILIFNRHIKKSIYLRMTIICISSVQISNITLFAVCIDRFVIIWAKICF